MKSMILRSLGLVAVLFVIAVHGAAPPRQPLPYKVVPQLPDALVPLSPADIHLDGWLGNRVALNASERLAQVDVEPLLAGFRQKPGVHPWIGEHIGKWMHAATLAWAYTGDPALRKKLDHAAAELIKAQEPDGYLGTYVPGKRFGLYEGSDWDVWSHKYNLLGLLTYYQYTGNADALQASRRIGDLLIVTFGPGRKSILSAGTHVGMAATSVLEPMVLLYLHTADPRYLQFSRSIVESWNEPNGPRILDTLNQVGAVNRTANAKAYEMLSNLVGLCELARASGDRTLLNPVLAAWKDIVANRLYVTGSASQGEHFRDDHHLPNQTAAHVSETCVTTTWIQLNQQLLRLTGEARFGQQLETTFMNHLAAAQRPDGAQWCYFTSLEGVKPYGPGINCCVSSGPRGMALVPQQAYLRAPARDHEPEALVVNLLGPSRVTTTLGGRPVTVEQQTRFPLEGSVRLVIQSRSGAAFGLRVRIPDWAGTPSISADVSGGNLERTWTVRDGWLIFPAQAWKNQDTLAFSLDVGPRWLVGEHGNAGRAALAWGPFVLAYDQQRNPGLPAPTAVALAQFPGKPAGQHKAGTTTPPEFVAWVRSARQPDPRPAIFVPFGDAGGEGGRYAVWLRTNAAPASAETSLFSGSQESRSEAGNVGGSAVDDDPETFVVTFNGQPQAEAWFAAITPQAVSVRRVVFVHGRAFHDGGWFDASARPPKIQVQRTPGSAWETLGELTTYPSTTGTAKAGLKDGDAFTLQLAEPLNVVGLRIVGQPACGDNPQQAFASCAELQAFSE